MNLELDRLLLSILSTLQRDGAFGGGPFVDNGQHDVIIADDSPAIVAGEKTVIQDTKRLTGLVFDGPELSEMLGLDGEERAVSSRARYDKTTTGIFQEGPGFLLSVQSRELCSNILTAENTESRHG